MEGLSEDKSCFFIDLAARDVYCRSCRKRCTSLALPEFTQFWCATRSCKNAGDVKLYRNGNWQVFTFVERRRGCCSEIVPKLLLTIPTEKTAGK
jgi:hypothetical protein